MAQCVCGTIEVTIIRILEPSIADFELKTDNIFYYCDYVTITYLIHCIIIGQQCSLEVR